MYCVFVCHGVVRIGTSDTEDPRLAFILTTRFFFNIHNPIPVNSKANLGSSSMQIFHLQKKMEAFRQPLIRKVLIVSRICQLTCLAKKNIYFGNNLIIYNKDNYIVVRMHLIIKSLLLETSSKCHLSLNSIFSLTLQNTLIFKLLSLQSRPLISY